MADVSPSRREYLILALIVLGASAIRLIGLTRESLWSDETFSAFATLFARPAEVVEYARGDVHPPGFFLGLWAWSKAFGNDEYALRLLPAVGGILMIPAMFRIGRQLYDTQTGLIAAFLSAFLIQSVYFSQEVRAYSWMATLGTVCVSLAIDCWRKGSWRLVLLLTVATGILAYLHYFGTLLAALVWVALIANPGSMGRGRGLLGAVLFFLALVPWLPYVAEQRSRVNWIPAPDLRYVTELFNVYYGPGLPVDVWTAAFLAAGIPLALSMGSFRLKSQENLLLGWIFVPLILVLAVSAVIRPVYSPRNMLISAGAAVLLLGRALGELGARTKRVWIPTLGFIFGTYAIHFMTGRGYFTSPTKQQIREASQFALDRSQPGAPIYAVAWDRNNFEYYFHLAGRADEVRSLREEGISTKGLASTVQESEFWVLSAGIDINQIDDIKSDFEIIESGEFLLARAYHLRRRHP